MDDFRKKQKVIYFCFKLMIVLTLSFMLIAPLFGAWYKANATRFTNISIILIALTIVATYFYSRYRKAAIYADKIEMEINDCGHYYSNYNYDDSNNLINSLYNRFGEEFYTINSDVSLDGRAFDFLAYKNSKYAYIVKCKKLDKETYFEYCDAVNSAISSSNTRQKRTFVLAIFCEKLDEDVINISKIITEFGKSIVVPMIINLSDNKAYFLDDKTFRLDFAYEIILNFPNGKIPDDKKWKGKLPSQEELKKKMICFNAKDFRQGHFNPRS